MTPNHNIEVCKRTRKLAIRSFQKVLHHILSSDISFSEVEIREMWLSELRKYTTLSYDGWYVPPPHGVAVLIGSDDDSERSRLDYKTLRPKEIWPQENIRLEKKKGILFVYASPFDNETGIIGDMGVTLYLGKKQEIRDHLLLCFFVVKKIFDFIEVGKTFSEVAIYTKNLLLSYSLNNEIECRTTPSFANNIGHTIPFVFEEMTIAEREILKKSNPIEIREMISRKRIFIDSSSDIVIKSGMAFTIEPRPKMIHNSKMPMVLFHAICLLYENGKKELLTNFDDLFQVAGMEYMMKSPSVH